MLDDLHALNNFAEYDVLTVQPRARNSGQKELRAIGVWASVGHRQQTWLGVLELEVLVLEFVAINRLAASAVLVGEVATLAHEVRDDTVERAALIAKTLLASAESAKVLCM